MAIPYNPQSDHGRGFLPVIARIVMFESGVFLAATNEWPMNVETARANLDRALEHARTVDAFLPYVAGTTRQYIDDWREQTATLRDSFRVTEGQDPEAQMTAAQKDLVKAHAEQTWALMSYLDRDLIGLTDADTDPGRTP
jgi:hypothetical protein